MTGRPQTRSQLVAGLGTSVTTVNRVVAQLEKAGAIITREIGSDGRQAVFRVVDVTGPKAALPYLNLGDQVRVVAARLSGDDMLVDVSVDKHTYRGVVRGVVTNVNLGGYATVQGIELVDDTLSNVRFEAHGATSGRPRRWSWSRSATLPSHQRVPGKADGCRVEEPHVPPVRPAQVEPLLRSTRPDRPNPEQGTSSAGVSGTASRPARARPSLVH